MSGVFSMASHSVLQYLLFVVRQEQIGCAHFLAIMDSMCFLPFHSSYVVLIAVLVPPSQ